MRKAATIFVVVSLIAMAFSGFQPSTAENPGGEVIGEYHQLGSSDDLTTSHTSWVDDVMEVEGPVFTDKIKVEVGFLEAELGAWSSDREFTVGDEVVEFGAQDVSIVNLSLGPEPVFTMGASDQIELLERPMWISAKQAEYGAPITLDLSDDDSSGQQLYIAKEWLWDRGIHRPNATHEDGTVLQVSQSEDGKGFIVDVHHFSEVVLNPSDLDLMAKQDGIMAPHLGESRWYEEEERLEIDVGQKVSDYEVWVEKDWIDMNINFPSLDDFRWEVDGYDGKSYNVVSIPGEGTPLTLEFSNFSILEEDVFTKGNPSILTVTRSGETIPFAVNEWNSSNNSLSLRFQSKNATISFSKDWLDGKEIDDPSFVSTSDTNVTFDSVDSGCCHDIPFIEDPTEPVPDSCDEGNAPQIGTVIEDEAGNTYAFYQNPIDKTVFLSYMLLSHGMSLGADQYGLSLDLWSNDPSTDPNEYDPDEGDWGLNGWGIAQKSIECKKLDQRDDFGFFIEGGAAGTTEQASITVEVWAAFGATGGWSGTGPSAEASAEWGGSISVTGELTWDHEVLIEASGSRHCTLTNLVADCSGIDLMIEQTIVG